MRKKRGKLAANEATEKARKEREGLVEN